MGKRNSGKLLYGVGLNDHPNKITPDVARCYKSWESMLKRCYSTNYKATRPTYDGCEVCEEWKSLARFMKWYDDNYVDGWCLDKDMIIVGNKVYSPDTCAFIPQDINKFSNSQVNAKSKTLLGCTVAVDKHTRGNKLFRASCRNPITKKPTLVGRYHTEEEAHVAWKKKKHEFALLIVDKYSGKVDERVLKSLSTRYVD